MGGLATRLFYITRDKTDVRLALFFLMAIDQVISVVSEITFFKVFNPGKYEYLHILSIYCRVPPPYSRLAGHSKIEL